MKAAAEPNGRSTIDMSNPRTHRKTRASYYTPSRVAAARENVEHYEWAAALKEGAVETADTYLARGLDGLWGMVTGQAIPRSAMAGDGTQRERWKPVPGERWTVTDGEVVLPTNDFGAYRDSGLDDRGFFVRYVERGGEPVAATLHDGTSLYSNAVEERLIARDSRARFTGRVVDFTRELSATNEIVVEVETVVDIDATVGSFIYVAVGGDANGVYRVEGVTRQGDSRVVFDVGNGHDCQPIRRPVGSRCWLRVHDHRRCSGQFTGC
jgi:hypothetical protein